MSTRETWWIMITHFIRMVGFCSLTRREELRGKFELLTALLMKIPVFCDVMLCEWYIGANLWEDLAAFIFRMVWKMKAARFFLKVGTCVTMRLSPADWRIQLGCSQRKKNCTLFCAVPSFPWRMWRKQNLLKGIQTESYTPVYPTGIFEFPQCITQTWTGRTCISWYASVNL